MVLRGVHPLASAYSAARKVIRLILNPRREQPARETAPGSDCLPSAAKVPERRLQKHCIGNCQYGNLFCLSKRTTLRLAAVSVNDNSNWRQICHAGVPPAPVDYFGSESGFHREKSASSGASMWSPALIKNGADFDYHPQLAGKCNLRPCTIRDSRQCTLIIFFRPHCLTSQNWEGIFLTRGNISINACVCLRYVFMPGQSYYRCGCPSFQQIGGCDVLSGISEFCLVFF